MQPVPSAILSSLYGEPIYYHDVPAYVLLDVYRKYLLGRLLDILMHGSIVIYAYGFTIEIYKKGQQGVAEVSV